MRRLWLGNAIIAIAMAVIVSACTGQSDNRSAGTTSTTSPPTRDVVAAAVSVPGGQLVPEGYIAADTRGVILEPVIAKPREEVDHTKPLLSMEDGKAKFKGFVVGPDGPLEEAVVRLERYVGVDYGRLDVLTDEDGEWEAKDVPGGRYRVRAWQKPALTLVEPRIMFVAEEAELEINFTLEVHDGISLQGALDAAEPHIGERVVFKALLTQETIDDDGIVRGAPIPAAAVAISALEGLRVVGGSEVLTDAEGFANFIVTCLTPGGHSVIITSSGIALAVGVPDCKEGAPPPETPDTTPPAELKSIAIGATFTVPEPGPLAPGTYIATGQGPCATSFEEFRDSRWIRGVSPDRGLKFPSPVRLLAAEPGSQPCTFRRTA